MTYRSLLLVSEQKLNKLNAPKVLGITSGSNYGSVGPVCAYNTANCLSYELTGFANNKYQAKINYTLDRNVLGEIKINGRPFVSNVRGSGSQWTGYDLTPGENYSVLMYKKIRGRLYRATRITITVPEEEEELASSEIVDDSTNNRCDSSVESVCRTNESLVWETNEFGCRIAKCSSAPVQENLMEIFIPSNGSYLKFNQNQTIGWSVSSSVKASTTKIIVSLRPLFEVACPLNTTCQNLNQKYTLVSFMNNPGNYVWQVGQNSANQTLPEGKYQIIVEAFNTVNQLIASASSNVGLVNDLPVFVTPPLTATTSPATTTPPVYINFSSSGNLNRDMNDLLSSLYVKRLETHKTLAEITGNYNSPEGPFVSERTGQFACAGRVIQNLSSGDACLEWMNGQWRKLGFMQAPIDPYGSPYLINEVEVRNDCVTQKDRIVSVGPDGKYFTPDDIKIELPYLTCTSLAERDAKRKTDLQMLSQAMENHYKKTGSYLISNAGWNGVGTGWVTYEFSDNYTRSLARALYEEGSIAVNLTSRSSPNYMLYVCNNGQEYALSATLDQPTATELEILKNSCNGSGNNGTASVYGKNYGLIGKAIVTNQPTTQAPAKNFVTLRKLKIETNYNNSWVAWREIELYDTNNVKLTITSSSSGSEYQDNVTEKAYDNNPDTVWNSGRYYGSIILDLGSNKQVSKIRLLPANYPNPSTATHTVKGQAEGESIFPDLTKFPGPIKDKEWLEYLVP
jgi:hypothetical protein